MKKAVKIMDSKENKNVNISFPKSQSFLREVSCNKNKQKHCKQGFLMIYDTYL